MSAFWSRLTSPLWVPILALGFGVIAVIYAAREMWIEVWA